MNNRLIKKIVHNYFSQTFTDDKVLVKKEHRYSLFFKRYWCFWFYYIWRMLFIFFNDKRWKRRNLSIQFCWLCKIFIKNTNFFWFIL